MIDASEILFMGIGKSAVLWYRCALPAIHIGADWVGVHGRPPGLQVMTGLVKGDTKLPKYADYKLIIMQQPQGREWLRLIHKLRDQGTKVLYEVDDYLHGVPKQKTHDFARAYTKKVLVDHEMCMRACDGIICSTDYIARRYAKFNRNIYVCRNGLDIGRYNLTRPERPTVNIGWSGATGHMAALLPWINAILPMLNERQDTCFVAIGQPALARAAGELLGAHRAIGIPFTQLESYPAAMCMFDIAIAPSSNSSWYRGKSDLRWLEAGALGIPLVGDPYVYSEIEDGVTGFHATTPEEAAEDVRMLIDDPELRENVGEAVKKYVRSERAIEVVAPQWMEVASAVVGEYTSMAQLKRAR